MNEMNFYTLNGEQYEVADKKAREANTATNEALKKKSDISYVNQTFSPAISVTVSGTAVSTDMVSPIEHEVECRVERINYVNDLISGIYNDGNFNLGLPQSPKYRSLDVILTPGVYTISASPKTKIVRYIHNGIWTDPNTTTPYTLRIDGGRVGFSFRSEPDSDWNGDTKLQLEKGSVATPYAPYVPDLTAVTVSRYGKNLAKVQDPSRKTLTSFPVFLCEGVTYTVSLKDDTATAEVIGFVNEKDTNFFSGGTSYVRNRTSFTYKADKSGLARCYIEPKSGGSFANAKFQLEVGDVQTAYEPYVEVAKFNPNSDGNVFGMTSVAPNMTILTVNPGVTIEATYNADTKKYIDKKFAELQAAIISTGGNV